MISHPKNSFTCNPQVLSHLKHVAQLLENKTSQHSALHQILKNHKTHFSKNQLSWLVHSRNKNPYWLNVVQKESESGTCLTNMVGPWTWDHILHEASFALRHLTPGPEQSLEIQVFLTDIVKYINYTLENLSVLRPDGLNFPINLAQNPSFEWVRCLPVDHARLMEKSLSIKHPQLALTDLMDEASTEPFHELIHISLTSKNPGLSIQDKIFHYLPSQIATYNPVKSNFYLHDPHFLIYEWRDLGCRVDWEVEVFKRRRRAPHPRILYSENRIGLTQSLIEASASTSPLSCEDSLGYLTFADRLEAPLTTDLFSSDVRECLAAHENTTNLSYNLVSQLSRNEYGSLIKKSGDLILTSFVDPIGSIKDFPIKMIV
jgi:hypothetical protein